MKTFWQKTYQNRTFSVFYLLSFIALIAQSNIGIAWAIDWPQYRGPELNGISTENIRTNWAAEPPKLIWKIPIEPGLCSFTISGGRVFTQVRREIDGKNMEVCIAMYPQTGNELWATPLDTSYYPGTLFPDSLDGPRSTPVVSGNRVFVYTSHLRLFCLEASTGTEFWHKDFCSELGSPELAFCGGASPVIEGGLVVVNCNHAKQSLTAFRPEDGSVAWICPEYFQLTHATSIPVSIGGIRQIIGIGHQGLFSVSPQEGQVIWLWSIKPYLWHSQAMYTMTPIVESNVVYNSLPKIGATAIQIDEVGGILTTNELWKTPGMNQNYWATPVSYQGHIYGTFGYYDITGNTNGYTGRFGCMELMTGKMKWTQTKIVNGGVILVGGYLIAATRQGTVYLIKPDPDSYQELGEVNAISDYVWNAPAFSDGRLYVRSRTEAACFDVAPPLEPCSSLQVACTQAEGKFRLMINNTDGSALALQKRDRIELLSTTNLGVGLESWLRLTNFTIFSNGEWGWEESLGTNQQRFFQTSEQP